MPEAGYTGNGKQASWAGFTTEEMLKLMHSSKVVDHITKMAQTVIKNTGRPDAFDLVLQNRPDTVRPRAYIMPNSRGIRLEIRDGLLTKAALGMSGK